MLQGWAPLIARALLALLVCMIHSAQADLHATAAQNLSGPIPAGSRDRDAVSMETTEPDVQSFLDKLLPRSTLSATPSAGATACHPGTFASEYGSAYIKCNATWSQRHPDELQGSGSASGSSGWDPYETSSIDELQGSGSASASDTVQAHQEWDQYETKCADADDAELELERYEDGDDSVEDCKAACQSQAACSAIEWYESGWAGSKCKLVLDSRPATQGKSGARWKCFIKSTAGARRRALLETSSPQPQGEFSASACACGEVVTESQRLPTDSQGDVHINGRLNLASTTPMAFRSCEWWIGGQAFRYGARPPAGCLSQPLSHPLHLPLHL